jgi:hypothetical protein
MLIVASNFGSRPADAAAEQSPLYASRIALTDADIAGGVGDDEALLGLDGGEGEDSVGDTLDGGGTSGGSGGGAGAGRSTVVSTLRGVIDARNGIVPSLTTSVNGTAAVDTTTSRPDADLAPPVRTPPAPIPGRQTRTACSPHYWARQ